MSLKIKVRESSYAGGKGFPKQNGTYIITVKDRRPGLHKGPYSVKARWSNHAMDWIIEDQDEISQLGSDTEVLDYKPFNQKEYDSLREQEQVRDLGSVRRKEPFNIPTAKRGEAYYSQGNRDGRKYAPMKTQESFPNRAAFLSYKKGYNEALDGIYEETGDQEFDKEVKDLKSKSDMGSLVNALDGMTDEQLALLEKGFGDGEYADKMDTTTMNIKAKDLHPTQNEIDVGKSLSYQVSGKNPEQVKQILDGGPVTVNLPLVVYDYNGTYYIVDGHHRWSQVFLLNPNCEIDSLVFKNSAGDTAQDPADMLRDFQGAIAIANDGEVPQSTVAPGMNMFDWSSDQLREYLDKNIQDGMVSAYQDFYNSELDKDDIENSIIGNAGLMKKSNKPIKNAPSRAVMPQTDTGVKKTGVAGIEIAKKGMTDL
jgi:hypothetical protein